MPLPLPKGKKIHIDYTYSEHPYEMPSMEIAPDHYSLGLILHGDRAIITPTAQYILHAGDMGTIAPFVYHKTLSASKECYSRILIKFSPEYVQPLIDAYGPHVIDRIFSCPVKRFPEDIQKRLTFIFQTMYDEYSTNISDYTISRLRCQLIEILLLVLEYSQSDESSISTNTPLSKPILDVIYFLENNFTKPIKIEDAAAICNYTTAYFSRLFKSQLHISYSDYLNNVRLRHVKSLLISTDKSITDIALETGFKYPGNMTILFKKTYGQTPYEFRDANR